jgi:hypothetical protein
MISAKQIVGRSEMLGVRLYCLVAIQSREHHPIWRGVPRSARWCFVVAHDREDARRIAADWLTPRTFKSRWLDPSLTSVDEAPIEGSLPSYGWVGDIAKKWSA